MEPSRPTAEQRAAIEAGPDGAFLVAAGPGTGKTYTMVQRFCWLVERQRVPPEAIMAVTFTEAAAGELEERLTDTLGTPARGELWVGTFHGLCARLLAEDAYLIGSPREARVLDEVGQRLLIERLQGRLRSGAESALDRDYEALSPDEVADLITYGPTFALKLKGRGIRPEEFERRALALLPPLEGNGLASVAEREAIESLAAVYRAYEAQLREAGRVDFDDLILSVIAALRESEEFRQRCRRRFRYLLVDEFQDSNAIQLELVRLLSAPDFGNVTVVGDAKQSIYGWRDAEIENIRSRFPGRRLPLTRNRRSYQEILDLATAFIRRDPDFAAEPELVAERGRAPQRQLPVSVIMASDPRVEARLVAAEIERLIAAGRRPSQIAILANSVRLLPREFEEELREREIPYVSAGGSGFFDREEVKDLVALARLAADPMDDGALVRVLQGPVVRLDDAAMYRLAARRFGRYGMRLRDCLEEARAEGWPELEPRESRRLERVLMAIDQVTEARDGLTVGDVLDRLLNETGYLRHSQVRARREGPRALWNLARAREMAGRFERDRRLGGITDFVAHLDRIMESALPVPEAALEGAEAVRLLTVHGAKGLEFEVVFLVNLRRPNPRDSERYFFDPDQLGFVMKYWQQRRHPRFKEHTPGARTVELARQERRRAVYVAMTRARDLLFVSASRSEREPAAVVAEEDDHFAEILSWALAHPEAARVVQAEQLELPVASRPAPPETDPEAVIARLERLGRTEPPVQPELPLRLSFSQLHQFEVCPVRYRYQQVWRMPAPPDELLPQTSAERGREASELGVAVHQALAAWHSVGGDLLRLYSGPPAGLEMLRAYLRHPLAVAPTRGTEVEFNLRLDGLRLRGFVDRICELEGRTVLVDYKTNAHLDQRLRQAYATQLRLYGLAARRGLLGGAADPRLVLFDLRRGEGHDVEPEPEAAEAWVREVAAKIRAGDFRLGAEHATRPCFLCAYRPICPERR
jgi:DNA helicase-2/ATP-dependent DNA helicase PcrA